jgi:histone arginine demethylase JMJD6
MTVEKKSGLSRKEFINSHLKPGVPVVLTDATKDWPGRKKFTPEFFKNNYPNKEITINGEQFKFGTFIDMMLNSTADNPAPYPCKFLLNTHFPELLVDVLPRFGYALPDRIGHRLLPRAAMPGAAALEVFLGGPGGKFPYLHYDYLHLFTFINQMYGDKEFTLYAPGQEKLVYADPENPWRSTIENHQEPDFEKYPLFKNANAIKVVVGAGETVFIPCGWWHTAKSLTPTVSIALDALNDANWNAFREDVKFETSKRSKMKAFLLDTYLASAGIIFNVIEKSKGY